MDFNLVGGAEREKYTHVEQALGALGSDKNRAGETATNVHPTLHLLAFGMILSLLLEPIAPIRFQQKIGLTSNVPLRRASPESRFFAAAISNGRLPVHCCLGVFQVKVKGNNEGLGRKTALR